MRVNLLDSFDSVLDLPVPEGDSPPGVTFRLAEWQDAGSFYRHCYTDRARDEWESRFRNSLQRQETGSLLYLVAQFGPAVIGGAKLVRYAASVEITDLIVAPAWRERGIGTVLITILEDLARRLQLPEVEIGVLETNPRALALYERLGYQKRRVLRQTGKPPAYILAKRL